jgi:hypothetical protein
VNLFKKFMKGLFSLAENQVKNTLIMIIQVRMNKRI